MPGDVLDDDDGVVDQDADREDQCEQADAVDGVAHQPGGKQRQQDRHRNDDRHDATFAPADGDGHQQHDRQRRKPKMEQQFVGLVVGGLAVVAGDDRHRRRRGSRLPFSSATRCDDTLGDDDGVGAGALGESDRDGWRALAACRPSALREVPGPLLERLGADDDIGDVAHIDGPAIARGQQQKADVGNALQRLPGRDGEAAIVVADAASQERAVGLAAPWR